MSLGLSSSSCAELPSLTEVGAERCRRSLGRFVRRAWEVVEPTTTYVHGWHIDAISEHLEAVTAGEIKRLLINIPPRHTKSLLVSVFWPAWSWTREPGKRFLYASYSGDLATEHSVTCRRLVQSSWYQERWGDVVRMAGDQNRKTLFENEAGGHRIATSVGGSGTGRGGDVLVADDPHNVKEAESDAKRHEVIQWWDLVMSTRLNDPDTGAKVIIMQRVHEADLSGHVLEEGGYEHLCLPAEYEADRSSVTVLGESDPRTEEGELLWPERFDRAALDDLKRALGPYGAAGQLQQRPAPREGGLFKRHFFEYVDPEDVPETGRVVRYWDKAATEGAGDYTVGARCRFTSDRFFVEDVVRGRWSPGPREEEFTETLERDGKRVSQYVEQEPGSSGKDSIFASIRNNPGFSVRADRVTGDKETRADPLAAWAETQRIYLVRGDWNRKALVDEFCSFPRGAHDDQVDAVAGAFGKLVRQGRKSSTGPLIKRW